MNTQQRLMPANGKIACLGLPSRDVIESSSFYHNVFEWIIRTRGDSLIAFDDTVNKVSGTWRLDGKPSADAGILICILVDDIKATVQAQAPGIQPRRHHCTRDRKGASRNHSQIQRPVR